MSERILTLFGEEMTPEQPKPAPKPRAKKKPAEKAEETPLQPAVQIPAAAPAPPPENTRKQPEPAPQPEEPDNVFELPEDWKGDKQYYTIGEVAKLFHVKTSHIRFWTNEFKLKVRTTRKGDRLYTPAQVRELRAIHHLVKERRFTLTGAKAKLKSQNKKDVETIDLKQSLKDLRSKLLIIRNKLNPSTPA